MKPIGIFGGTFDPIHFGHLRTAFELLNNLRLSEIRFIPSRVPPHRDVPVAPAAVRLQMVRSSIAHQPRFVLDDRELARDGLSYTVDTLQSLRAEFEDCALCLIVGMDALLGLTTWHRWQEILELGHIVVARRPGWSIPDKGPLGELLATRGTQEISDLAHEAAGRIIVHSVTQLDISSSTIREIAGHGGDPRFLVPDEVCEIISASGCYTEENTTGKVKGGSL